MGIVAVIISLTAIAICIVNAIRVRRLLELLRKRRKEAILKRLGVRDE